MRTLLALLVLVATTSSATAGYVPIYRPDNMPADGIVNWGNFGPAFTTVSSSSSLAVTGIPGLTATISQTDNAPLRRLDQGEGWPGNFKDDATLIHTYGNHGPVDIVFSRPVAGVGAQYQADYPGAFTARMLAYDASDNLLGTIDFSGMSNRDADNSAVFVGFASSSTNISKIRFEGLTDGSGRFTAPNDFAIGNLSVQSVSTVPEPMSLITFSGLFVGLAGMVRMQRQTKPAQA